MRSVEERQFRVDDFILDFEAKHNKIAKKSMKLPESVLAFKLINCAGLSKQEKMLALSGLDYEKTDDLFKHAKSSISSKVNKLLAV